MPDINPVNLLPKLVKYGMPILQEALPLCRNVNSDVKLDFSAKGKTVDYEVPPLEDDATDVVVGTPGTDSETPTTVPLSLDFWKEKTFNLDADQVQQFDAEGFLSGRAKTKLQAAARAVEDSIRDRIVDVWNFAGLAAATPDAITDINETTKIMDLALCPPEGRAYALSSVVKEKFMNLDAFTSAEKIGHNRTMIEGDIGRRLGFDFALAHRLNGYKIDDGTQNDGYLVNDPGAANAIGNKTCVVDTGTGTILAGTVFKVAGDVQQGYVITSDYAGGAGTIAFEPGMKVAWGNNAVISIQADHYVGGLAFTRDWLGMASRPVALPPGAHAIVAQEIDPVSGLVLQLKKEYTGHWRMNYSWSILWGVKQMRGEYACRLLSLT
jgi:hypothetical protein